MNRNKLPLLLICNVFFALCNPIASFGQSTIQLAKASPAKQGSPGVPTAGPTKGALVVVGGGAVGEDIWAKFIELAGGAEARIVFVPTAAEDGGWDADKSTQAIRKHGAKEVTILHTRNPKEADTEKFIEPLKTATGVWFGGGRQWRIADSYLNTCTQKAFESVLERGGVIGGTSAGATIQGSFLVRGDTKGNETLIGDHIEGFGYIKNVAIDQHVLRRNRQFDLISVLETHPDLLGIGIDESTAIVVQGDTLEVLGRSYVAIYDAHQWQQTNGVSNQKRHFSFLSPTQKFDLKTRKVIEPPRQAVRSGTRTP